MLTLRVKTEAATLKWRDCYGIRLQRIYTVDLQTMILFKLDKRVGMTEPLYTGLWIS